MSVQNARLLSLSLSLSLYRATGSSPAAHSSKSVSCSNLLFSFSVWDPDPPCLATAHPSPFCFQLTTNYLITSKLCIYLTRKLCICLTSKLCICVTSKLSICLISKLCICVSSKLSICLISKLRICLISEFMFFFN